MSRLRSRAGDRVFEELARRHAGRAYRVARACLGGPEAAEDAVQECFLRLVRARGTYRPGMRFSPWFYALLRNACRDELRRRARARSHGGELPEPAGGADPCAQVLAREDLRAARLAFGRLPAPEREVLALRLGGGLEFSAIAGACGISTDAAKKRAYRGLARLRRDLAARR